MSGVDNYGVVTEVELPFDGRCETCGKVIPRGALANHVSGLGVVHLDCPEESKLVTDVLEGVEEYRTARDSDDGGVLAAAVVLAERFLALVDDPEKGPAVRALLKDLA